MRTFYLADDMELDKTKLAAMIKEAQLLAFDEAQTVGTTHYVANIAYQPEVRGMRLGGGTFGQGMYAKEYWLDK